MHTQTSHCTSGLVLRQICMHGTLPVSSFVALCSLATYHLDGRMDLSVETVLDSNRRHLPESIFWSGNWLMMDQILTPSKTVTKQFPAPLIPQSDGRQRRLPSSTSTLLMHHQHRNPHGLKTLYPDEEIISGSEEDVSFIQDRFTTWVKGRLRN